MNKKYFFISIFFHLSLLIALILGLDWLAPLAVLENTDKKDVISAVVLGDIPESKILPQPQETPTPQKVEISQKEQIEKAKKAAIKLAEKKRALEKKKQALKQKTIFAKELLADMDKQNKQHKKLQQKKLKNHFEKTLVEQAEKSMRQQLLDEKIHLQAKQLRQSQGEINKYKALILQAISEHWIVPSGSNKALSCELMIRLAPGGNVIAVEVIKKSGDVALDSSARNAVLKASPLPVPKEPSQFEAFRQFVLKVKPKNIM